MPIDFVGGASIGAIIARRRRHGLERRGDAPALPAQLRRHQSGERLHLSVGRAHPRPQGLAAARARVRRRARSRICALPFFCVSANLTTRPRARASRGPVWRALRASVAIPGVMPPVFRGDDVLVDGAAINNLPRRHHARASTGSRDRLRCERGPSTRLRASRQRAALWRLFARSGRRINIFQILMQAGMVNSVSSAAAQRSLADVLLKPPLASIDLLDWRAFDRAIEAGYHYARGRSRSLPSCRASPRPPARRRRRARCRRRSSGASPLRALAG